MILLQWLLNHNSNRLNQWRTAWILILHNEEIAWRTFKSRATCKSRGQHRNMGHACFESCRCPSRVANVRFTSRISESRDEYIRVVWWIRAWLWQFLNHVTMFESRDNVWITWQCVNHVTMWESRDNVGITWQCANHVTMCESRDYVWIATDSEIGMDVCDSSKCHCC